MILDWKQWVIFKLCFLIKWLLLVIQEDSFEKAIAVSYASNNNSLLSLFGMVILNQALSSSSEDSVAIDDD